MGLLIKGKSTYKKPRHHCESTKKHKKPHVRPVMKLQNLKMRF